MECTIILGLSEYKPEYKRSSIKSGLPIFVYVMFGLVELLEVVY